MKLATRGRLQHGVSLIEALVALAVMAIGMLGLVGVQSVLRSTSDVSKQRSEALRLAQVEVERWRSFTTLAGYNNLALGTGTEVGLAGSNATFTRKRTVAALAAPNTGKSLAVEVSWQDRTGENQTVRLATLIAGIGPELAGTLTIPGEGDLVRQPQGRLRGIPVTAKDLGDGTSAFKPPGAPGDVAWRFDNVTGLIRLCTVDPALAPQTSDLTIANLVCGAQNALGVSGFVRYALTTSQPQEADARNPQSDPVPPVAVAITDHGGGVAPTCYSQAVLAPSKYVVYHCAVPVTVIPGVAPTWRGNVAMALTPADLLATTLAENSASKFKVCSYPSPGALAGSATFDGGAGALVLTQAAGSGGFRSWSAGSRIDLVYDSKVYAFSVASSVAVPTPPATSQTVPLRQLLPGSGNGLTGMAYSDVAYRTGSVQYENIATPLVNHNYLVIRAGDTSTAFTCPLSTVAHQPAS